MMYAALVGGGAPIPLPEAGSYDDYCARQHQYMSALTLDSPQVRAWVEFFENNDGTLPDFPLPLGDGAGPSPCDLMSVTADGRATNSRIRIRLHGGGRPVQRWRVRVRCARRT